MRYPIPVSRFLSQSGLAILPSKKERAVLKAGVGIPTLISLGYINDKKIVLPHKAPFDTISLQPAMDMLVCGLQLEELGSLRCALWMALLKKSSKSKFSSSGLLRYAVVMSLRKTDRIMHPPRHIKAISGRFNFHLVYISKAFIIQTGGEHTSIP